MYLDSPQNLSVQAFLGKFQRRNVKKFHVNSLGRNATMSLVKLSDKSAETFQDSSQETSALMFQERWRVNNVGQSLDRLNAKNVKMFPGRTALMFHDKLRYKSATKSPERIVTLSLERFASQLTDSNVTRCLVRYAIRFPGSSATR